MNLLPVPCRSIREIEARQWDRLAGDNPFATHGWLLTVENTCRAKVEPLYFTLYRESSLVAAAVCYVFAAACEIESPDDLFFGRVKGLARAAGLSFLPAMVCGPVLGCGWHIGVAATLDTETARQARTELLKAMETEAHLQKLDLSFVHVLDEERDLHELLIARGYRRCRNAPVATLDVAWSSFDDYLAGLPRRHRGEFRRQIKRNRESGSVIECVEAGVDPEPRILALIDDNARKHGVRAFPLGEGLVGELRRNLGPCARFFTSRRLGRLNGVMVMLVRGATAYAMVVGVDSGKTNHDYTYFHLAYNAPIAYAVDAGIRRIYYGRGMYEVKLRRGCTLTGNWVYSRATGRRSLTAAAWFPLASYWNSRKLSAKGRRLLRSGIEQA